MCINDSKYRHFTGAAMPFFGLIPADLITLTNYILSQGSKGGITCFT